MPLKLLDSHDTRPERKYWIVLYQSFITKRMYGKESRVEAIKGAMYDMEVMWGIKMAAPNDLL